MKKGTGIFFICFLGLLFSISVYGQSGVFMSVNDYKNNKITHERDCPKEKHDHNLRLKNIISYSPTFDVIYGGKKYTYKKSEVFGFRDCDKKVYRFYNNIEYCIAEAGNVDIYTREIRDDESKTFKLVKNYYFSTSLDGAIIPLTIENLKQAYQSNDRFLEELDKFFGKNNVGDYDKLHSTYKINYLYNQATK